MGWHGNNIIDFVRSGIQPGVEHAESYLEEIYAQAKKESQRKKTEAARKGTEVHEILSGEASTESLSLDAGGSRLKVELAREWLKENNVEFLHIERPIYSRRYRYSGRLDGVAKVNGVLSLLDYKTGRGIYPEFRLQTAAYNHALEEELEDLFIEQRLTLHLTEEACIPHPYPRSKLRGDFTAFLGAQRLHQQIKKIEKEEKN